VAPRDAAGLAAAQDFGGRHAQHARHVVRGFGGQGAAGREHRAQAPVQRFPRQLRRQALEVRGTGDQHRILTLHRRQQVLREERTRHDRAP